MEGGGDTSCGVESVFSEFGAVLGREAELREQLRVTVRELEQVCQLCDHLVMPW